MLEELIAKYQENPCQFYRENNPEIHLSASIVIMKEEKMLFVEHPYQKELLLPAGHVEIGEIPEMTALRELTEETGFEAKKEVELIEIHLISIPEYDKTKPAHTHLDFRFKGEVVDVEQKIPELPVFFLSKEEAPEEFRKYYMC